MYTRYTIFPKDQNSAPPVGLFTVAYDLRDEKTLPPKLQQEFETLLEEYEHVITTMKADFPGEPFQDAVCWYKPSAVKAIQKTAEIATILRSQGYKVQVSQERDPGLIIRQDKDQVSAVPCRNSWHRFCLWLMRCYYCFNPFVFHPFVSCDFSVDESEGLDLEDLEANP